MSVANFLQDGQDTKVVEKIHVKILDMLGPSEQIQYIAVQKKPAVTLLPDSITISDKRIFLCEFTKFGLSTNFEIFTWENIKDIAFKEEIFGSKVTVIPFTGENLTVDYIPKVQARRLYQLIKVILDELNKPKQQKRKVEKSSPKAVAASTEREESMQAPAASAGLGQKREEKNIRQHNEGPSVAEPATKTSNSTPTSTMPSITAAEDDELTRKLEKLKSLYDRQLITQAEYENKKLELLSQL